jgi:hypothetical protein
VFSQRHEDGWHPIAFFSRKFSNSKWNYPIYDKEMLAIVKSFEHWRHYLDGAKGTEVYSDHQNLKDFMSQTKLDSRQTRWLIKLLPYDFHLFYRKGTLNPADGPSRRPDYLANTEEVNSTPASHLLPVLRDRLDQNESIEKTIKSADEFNDRTRAARFPIVPRAVNAIDTAIILDASKSTVVVTDIAAARVEEMKRIKVHNEDSLTPNVGQSFDTLILPSDEVARRDLETLRAQVLTKTSAREVLTGQTGRGPN